MIQENSRVIVSPNLEEETGTVEQIIDNGNRKIVLVRLDRDNSLIKCGYDDIKIIPEETVDTITLEDFTEATQKLTNPGYFIGKLDEQTSTMVAMSAVLICQELKKELFGVDYDNAI